MFDIKILKNNYQEEFAPKESIKTVEPYPRKLICEGCRSELEYDESDLIMGEYGCMFIDCPICGGHNMLEDNEHSITLTVDNIEFPVHFHHVSKESGAKDRASADEVRSEIKKAVDYFRENKEEYSYYTWCGNLCVAVYRYSGDEEYSVIVSSDFYNTEIPFEEEDYE